MGKIFISYKREDLKKVKDLINEIKEKTNIDCWIDIEGIEGGDNVGSRIIDAILNSDVVLFMMSNLSIKSQYTEREIKFAYNKNKRIVPISIDGTTINDCDWLCFLLKDTDFIDPQKSYQWEKLMNNIIKWTSTPINHNTTPVKNVPNYKTEKKENNTVTIEYNESGLKAAYLDLETDCIKSVTFSNGKKTLPTTLVYKNGQWMFENLDFDNSNKYSNIVFDIPHLIFSNNEDIQYMAHLYNIQLEESIYGDLKLNLNGTTYTIHDIIVKYIELLKIEIENQINYTFNSLCLICSFVFDIQQIRIINEIFSKAGLKIRYYDSALAITVYMMNKRPADNNNLVLDIRKNNAVLSIINTGDCVFDVKYLNNISINESQMKHEIDLALRESELTSLNINQILVLNTSSCQSPLSMLSNKIFANSQLVSCSPEDVIKGGCLIATCINGYLKDFSLCIMPLTVIPQNIYVATDHIYAKIIMANTTKPTKKSIKIKNHKGQNRFFIKLYSTFPSLSFTDEIEKRKMIAQYVVYLGTDSSNEYELTVDIDAIFGFNVKLSDINGKEITLHKENYSEDCTIDLPIYCPN